MSDTFKVMFIEHESLQSLFVSDAAWDDFVDRVRPLEASFPYLNDALCDLVVAEGRFTLQRPQWAPSWRPSAGFIQVGEFLLLVLERGEQPEQFWVQSMTTSAPSMTWQAAYEQGLTRVPVRPVAPRVPTAEQIEQERARLWQARLQAPLIELQIVPPATSTLPPLTVGAWRDRREQRAAQRTAATRAERENEAAREAWFREQDVAYAIAVQEHRAYAERYEREWWPAYLTELQQAYRASRGLAVA